MLIIGDVAIKELNPKYNVKTVEIITAGKDITHLENVFNASIKSNKITEYAEEYRLKFDRKLLLYNCNKSAFLDDLLIKNFAKKSEFKFATTKDLYCMEYIKITELFFDVTDWERAIKNFNFLLRNFILPIKDKEPKTLKILESRSTPFYPIVTSSPLINSSFYEFRQYDIYSETDLHNIYARGKKNFNTIAYGPEKLQLSEGVWKIFNYEEQISAVLERAYVIAINEFVIPYWLDNKKMPKNPRELFKTALMILTSQVYTDWFAMFIVYNYNIIMNRFNDRFINLFNNALKYNDLEQIN